MGPQASNALPTGGEATAEPMAVATTEDNIEVALHEEDTWDGTARRSSRRHRTWNAGDNKGLQGGGARKLMAAAMSSYEAQTDDMLHERLLLRIDGNERLFSPISPISPKAHACLVQ